MKDLTIKNHNGINVVDSREVAEMVGKRHDHLMRDIQGYIKVLDMNPKLGTSQFFIKSTYLDAYKREKPCYLLTKQGCEMVANKMTGEKGILFTAEYVQAFNKMENVIKNNEYIRSHSIEELSDAEILNKAVNIVKNIVNENITLKKELEEKTTLINQISNCINGISLPVKQKVELSEDEFRNLIVEFMNENDVVLKSHRQGLAIDKDALYKYMNQYGWTQHDVLEALDKYSMIYHSGEDKTQRLRLNGKIIRALVIQ